MFPSLLESRYTFATRTYGRKYLPTFPMVDENVALFYIAI